MIGKDSSGNRHPVLTDGKGALIAIPSTAVNTQTGTATTTSAQVTFTSAPTQFFLIQNTAASGTLYVNFGAAATTSSLALAPGVAYETPVVPTNSVNVLGSASVTYVILSA